MSRRWNIELSYDENATEEEQIEQIISSANRNLITLNKKTAKDLLRQIENHHYPIDETLSL